VGGMTELVICLWGWEILLSRAGSQVRVLFQVGGFIRAIRRVEINGALPHSYGLSQHMILISQVTRA